MMEVTFGTPADDRSLLQVRFPSWEAYQAAAQDSSDRQDYVRMLYAAVVGRVLPVRIALTVPQPADKLLPKAKDVIRSAGGVVDGSKNTLLIYGTVVHPEGRAGEEITADMLEAIAPECFRQLAREVADGLRK